MVVSDKEKGGNRVEIFEVFFVGRFPERRSCGMIMRFIQRTFLSLIMMMALLVNESSASKGVFSQISQQDKLEEQGGRDVDKAEEKQEEFVLQIELEKGEIVFLDKEDIQNAVAYKEYSGDGYLSWNGWCDMKKNGLLSSFLEVSLLDDPIYTSMKLPSENTNYFYQTRVNASIMDDNVSGHSKACGIGAFYPVYGEKLPDTFNLCVGRFMVFVLKYGENSEWEPLGENTFLQRISNLQIRPLPWTEQMEISATRPVDKVKFNEEYIEFNLTAEDLMQTEQNPDGSVVHFYSDKLPIVSDEIRACVVIYEMWSDTPEIEGKVVATIGFDFWADSSYQMFSGHNYLVTNEHRQVIGHNISDELYDALLEEGKSPMKCWEYFMEIKESECTELR